MAWKPAAPFEFIQIFGNLFPEISRLTGMSFSPHGRDTQSPVGRALVGLFQLHNLGEYELRDHELLRLGFLVKHLREIEQARPQLLQEITKPMRKAGPNDSFYGFRFETNIAASLIRHGAVFDKSEAPDFLLTASHAGLAIECGSAHIRNTERTADPLLKVAAAVRKKSKKAYSANTTALFLDITNLYYALAKSASLRSKEEVRRAATRNLKKSGFGSIVLFSYLVDNVDKQDKQLVSNYIRADSEGINPRLLSFLDDHYPTGDVDFSEYVLVKEG